MALLKEEEDMPLDDTALQQAPRPGVGRFGREAEERREWHPFGLEPPSPETDEGNHVPVRVADVKIRAAPGLLGWRLAEFHAPRFEFFE